jgi:Protein of unknown function (DUF2924)
MAQRFVDPLAIEAEIDRVRSLGLDELRELWRSTLGAMPPPALTKDLLVRMIAYRIQEQAFGGLDRTTTKLLDELARGNNPDVIPKRRLKTGTVLVREYQGQRHTVTIVPDGYVWRETKYKPQTSVGQLTSKHISCSRRSNGETRVGQREGKA